MTQSRWPTLGAESMHIVRWILFIPAAIAGWYGALFFSILVLNALGDPCAPEPMANGDCIGPIGSTFGDVMIIVGASLSAVLVVLIATIVAPDHKVVVARLTYAAGFVVAVILAVPLSLWVAFAGAALAGLATLALIERRYGPRTAAE